MTRRHGRAAAVAVAALTLAGCGKDRSAAPPAPPPTSSPISAAPGSLPAADTGSAYAAVNFEAAVGMAVHGCWIPALPGNKLGAYRQDHFSVGCELKRWDLDVQLYGGSRSARAAARRLRPGTTAYTFANVLVVMAPRTPDRLTRVVRSYPRIRLVRRAGN